MNDETRHVDSSTRRDHRIPLTLYFGEVSRKASYADSRTSARVSLRTPRNPLAPGFRPWRSRPCSSHDRYVKDQQPRPFRRNEGIIAKPPRPNQARCQRSGDFNLGTGLVVQTIEFRSDHFSTIRSASRCQQARACWSAMTDRTCWARFPKMGTWPTGTDPAKPL